MTRTLAHVCLLLNLCHGSAALAQALRGYQAEVNVQRETRLEWGFALANQSPAQLPAAWVSGYESAAQRYELFVPPNLDAKKPAALVLFISPSDGPAGWKQWEKVCQASNVIFASPYSAGNSCPAPRRMHIVLDVLDDLRRRFSIDADRTYLAGFSGGARVACSIAFALPEYFGGVVGVCGAEKLRDESWLRQRVTDRLSVALVTGDDDFNRGELERLRGPMFTELGVRAKVWTVPKLGHGIPDDRELAAVFTWLEAGAADRRRYAKTWPASRITPSGAPTRSETADALLKEARERIAKPATLYSGLMQLQGVSVRWPDLPAAATAGKLLAEYDSRQQRPWEADDIAEQRKYLIAEARGLDRYASGPLPPQYAPQRVSMAQGAIERWQQILADDPTSAAGKEAARRIPELEALVLKDKGS